MNKSIDVALKVSEILSNTDHEIHMVLRSPKEGSDIPSNTDLIVIPVTDEESEIYGKYETVSVSNMYELFKTINTGVSSVDGSPDLLSMYFGTNTAGTIIGNHKSGYVLKKDQLNDFKNHCKIKLSPKGYIYVLTVEDVSNADVVVDAIRNVMEIA
jgi:hypothetical protein